MGNFTLGTSPVSPSETLSLQERSEHFNAQNPRHFSPNGLNQPIMLSPNGNSAADAARQTPMGQLPSLNGMSQSTYNQIVPSSYGIDLKV
jgi:hypothetical protein